MSGPYIDDKTLDVLYREDPDKLLMLLVTKRINQITKNALVDQTVSEAEACLIVEKWTDAILYDFAVDLVENEEEDHEVPESEDDESN